MKFLIPTNLDWFHDDFQKNNSKEKQAIFAFNGDVYDGIDANTISTSNHEKLQSSLRILSGLYGILKPFDIIQPYRLEMGTNTVKLINSSLYEFWSNDISQNLNEELKINGSKYLFNLSSKEYFSVLDYKKINAEVINFDFKVKLNNEYKNIGMQIKKMRGSMAKFIIDNKIDTIGPLKNFEVNNFKFEKLLPKTNTLLFTA